MLKLFMLLRNSPLEAGNQLAFIALLFPPVFIYVAIKFLI